MILSLPVVLFRHKNSVCIINHLERNLDFYRESLLSLQAGESSVHISGEVQRGQKPGVCMYLRSPDGQSRVFQRPEVTVVISGFPNINVSI